MLAAGEDGRALLLLGQLASNGHGESEDPVRARGFYERSAEQGNAEAAHNLGVLSATGRGGAQDLVAALRWYGRSSDMGDMRATRMVGVMYAAGQGVPVDEVRAEQYLRAAASGGEAQSFHDLGILFTYHKVDLPEGAHWFLLAAKDGVHGAVRELTLLAPKLRALAEGDRRARTMLGVILAFYLDDPVGAVTLLTVSAEDGDPVAQRTLGFLVQRGVGVARDEVRATALFRAAAEAGDAIGAFNLGVQLGKSPEAVRWLWMAAEAGIVEAFPVLGDRLSEFDLDVEALKWYLRGAESGDKGCMFAAASWYRDGFGGPVDRVQALRWYLAMLNGDSGDGVHQADVIAAQMTDEEIHEAGRLSGRLLEADLLLIQRRSD